MAKTDTIASSVMRNAPPETLEHSAAANKGIGVMNTGKMGEEPVLVKPHTKAQKRTPQVPALKGMTPLGFRERRKED